ncbi:nuclear pore protein NUP57 [Pochonia chlamydosporia 170]|uniref:Nuclear pore protein NUP57 n=1 Tax=Pochonia chlamydosporia 170 TaxID=1380566 RepID=A0A179FNQ8_METCM|nr:nuclear pore protein NUP57 [Pochonia chlamydosporia 170]OAQ67295.1 nuclear pore protein NUP57 [Pochonia chlamydosporia 170]
MSLFGQPKPLGSGGLFGQTQTAQQTQPAQQTGSVFGQTMGGQQLPGASIAQQQQVQQMPTLAQSQAQLSSSLWQPGKETPHQKPILDQIKLVTEKWDPANPSCVFKHHFYNKVDEAHIPFYKPQPHEDPSEWEEALQNKPAPGFMPVLCSGYTGLADRLKTQKRAISEFNTRLHQVNGSLDAILQRHELETEVRALAARRRQTAISERCLALAAKVQILRNRGYALSGDEDDLKNRLQTLEREVQDPALGAREEELWSRLIVLRGYSDRLNKELDKPAGQDGEGLDPETEAKAKRVLEDYEKQLQHLKKELEALGVDFEEWEKSRNAPTKSR